tara:strand:+ start:42325 stop:42690 length:366 start_codon:yes stop_codon:yes gene_type:complete
MTFTPLDGLPMATRSGSIDPSILLYLITEKTMGVDAVAAGRLDTLAFTGGIGENSAIIREQVCRRSAWLGVQIDPAANSADGPLISGKIVLFRCGLSRPMKRLSLLSRRMEWFLKTDFSLN